MRNAIRSPLTWMVLAEMVVVGALLALAWTAITGAARPASAAPAPAPQQAPPDSASPLPDLQSLSAVPGRGPLPGLNVNPLFWRARLEELNRDQVLLSDIEWRLVHAGMAAARDYVETVVLPSIRRAERAAVG